MIARLWHGWTAPDQAQAYEELLRAHVLPGIDAVEGYRGAYLLRRELEDEVEFATITLFDSLDAVRAFAGEDHEQAVVPPEARQLLAHFDERSEHYEILITPGG
ncbi:MAG: antibiotic biosynthesis monooxygenase [Actinomycetota bacterium]|nr:antibiotic biosynthesis monooxygenase [Actinomycetota bacterium]